MQLHATLRNTPHPRSFFRQVALTQRCPSAKVAVMQLPQSVTASPAWSRGFQKKKIVYFFCKRLVKRAFGKTIRVDLCPSVVEKMAGNQGNQTEIRPPQTKKLY